MILVYTNEHCVPCKAVKKDLNDWGVDFVERPVIDYYEELAALGFKTVPVVVVDGAPVVGHNREKMKELLGL